MWSSLRSRLRRSSGGAGWTSPSGWQLVQKGNISSVNGHHLPLHRNFLPLNNNLLPLKKKFLPLNSDLLPLNRNLLPLNSDCLPLNNDHLTVKCLCFAAFSGRREPCSDCPKAKERLARESIPSNLHELQLNRR